eukprot:1152079-Pelagomonas_calceolata.AAC.17
MLRVSSVQAAKLSSCQPQNHNFADGMFGLSTFLTGTYQKTKSGRSFVKLAHVHLAWKSHPANEANVEQRTHVRRALCTEFETRLINACINAFANDHRPAKLKVGQLSGQQALRVRIGHRGGQPAPGSAARLCAARKSSLVARPRPVGKQWWCCSCSIVELGGESKDSGREMQTGGVIHHEGGGKLER